VRHARALLLADAALRISLGVLWLVAGFEAALSAAGWRAAAAATLGLSGALLLAGRLPRLATAAGGAAALALLPLGAGLALLAGALLRLALWMGPAAGWLARVERLSRDRALHLAATELGRARAARLADAEASRRALARAGDAYERAGRARLALAGLGAEPGLLAPWARAAAAVLARALRLLPAAQDALERVLHERSRRRAPVA
jgi:hypothetical protein